jgi:hypothetical protein
MIPPIYITVSNGPLQDGLSGGTPTHRTSLTSPDRHYWIYARISFKCG